MKKVLSHVPYFASNFFARLAHMTLGKLNSKHNWLFVTTSILLVLKSFMKNLLTAKSSEDRSDLSFSQGAGLKVIITNYIYIYTLNQLQDNLFRSDTSNFPQNAFAERWNVFFVIGQRAFKSTRQNNIQGAP